MTDISPPSTAAPAPARVGRPPLLPRRAAPVVDRLLGARPARVVRAAFETPTIRVLELEAPPGFTHVAGQHVVLRLQTDEGPDLRPLSVASAPGGATIEVATRSGPSAFKRALADLRPGDTVRVSRPMGAFRFDRAHPAVVVTGGIGITPVRSMLLDALTSGWEQPVRLLFSNRTPDDVPYRHDLVALAGAHPNLEVTWVLTEPGSSTEAAGVHLGHVDEALLAHHVEALAGARIYLTGPAAMVTAMRELTRRIGVPRRRVRAVRQSLPVDRHPSGPH